MRPSTPEIKLKELSFLEIESNNLGKYGARNPSQPPYRPLPPQDHPALLSRLQARHVVAFGNPHNRVLQAFSYLLLKTVYGRQLDEQLLKIIKVNLYDEATDLSDIAGHPLGSLSSDEMKKFVVEFIFQLCFSDFSAVLDRKLQKHTVVLDILTLFLRALLLRLGLEEARDYHQALPTETVVELLSDYLDLNYRKNAEAYLFLDSTLFLHDHQDNTFVGLFGEESPSSRQFPLNPERLSFSTSPPFGLAKEISNSEESCLSVEAPTPFFHCEQPDTFLPRQDRPLSPKCWPLGATSSRQSPFGTIFEREDCRYPLSSPSVASIEQKLQCLLSPAFSDGSERGRLNRFDLAVKSNGGFFVQQDQDENRDELNDHDSSKGDDPTEEEECECRAMARQNIKLVSGLYSLSIEPSPRPLLQCHFNFASNFTKKQPRKTIQLATERLNDWPRLTPLEARVQRAISKTEESQESSPESPGRWDYPCDQEGSWSSFYRPNRSSSGYSTVKSPPSGSLGQILFPKIRFTYTRP